MKDYSNKKYGLLTGINFTGNYYTMSNGLRRSIWKWKCDCGKIHEAIAADVVSGKINSCGCRLGGVRTGKYTGIQSLAYEVYKARYNDGDITFEQFEKLSQECCWYCGSLPENKHVRKHKKLKHVIYTFIYNGLDRMNNDEPHNNTNVVPCCWNCNNLKSNSSTKDFLKIIDKIFKYRIDR